MPDLTAGSVFAGHRIEAFLGRGETGAVYRATHLRLRQPRALKVISAALSVDPAFREQFVRVARRPPIDHPNLVAVYDADKADGTLYVSMALIEGTDLRAHILRRERLEPEFAARVLGQVASALDAVHASGAVHGDLKPSDILLEGDPDAPHAYITDIGLGQPAPGEFDHAAPERLEGRELDARSDVYSLGCVLFHAVTGSAPYPAESRQAKAHAHAHEPPPAAAALVPGLSPAVDQVIARAMQKQQADRYPSAGAFGRALAAAARDGATRARTIAGAPVPLDVQPTPAPQPTRADFVQPPAPPVPPPRPPPPLPPALHAPGTAPPPPGDSALRKPAVLIPLALAAVAAVVVIVLAATGAFSGDGKKESVAKKATPATPATPPPPPTAADAIQPGATLTIYSSLPEQGAAGGQARAIENGAQLALDEAGGRVGEFRIDYQRLDDSLASTGAADESKAAQNARMAVADDATIGYIGEYNSGISKVSIPILNKAAIAQVSPSNTFVGLTVGGPGADPGDPDKYYPSGKRTYARVVPNDTVQGAALATAAKQAGCSSVQIWSSGTTYAAGLAKFVEDEAARVGMQVEDSIEIDPKAPNYRSRARSIRADCFVWTGEAESNGAQALTDAAQAPSVKRLFSGDGQCFNDGVKLPAGVARRLRCTIVALDPDAFGSKGRKFFEDYAAKFNEHPPDPYAINGYESMGLLLDAISRASDGGRAPVTRTAVVDALFATSGREGAMGTYSIDENGDTTLRDYGLYKVAGGGLTFDRVLRP
jgi:branched-chain amino acid transport system substrate-binding protein